MADWAVPVLTSRYDTVVLPALKERDTDALTLGYTAYTNPPTGAFKYVRASNKFQEYNGATWDDKLLAIAGGGTGSATAANARTALGIGTMGTQDSNAVTITGGTITGATLNGTNISSGTVAVARGGTGLASYTAGDILYASAATTISKLGLGTAGYFLRTNLAGTSIEYANLGIGSIVQAYNSNLTAINQALTTTSNVQFNSLHTAAEVHVNEIICETTAIVRDDISIGYAHAAADHSLILYDGVAVKAYIKAKTGSGTDLVAIDALSLYSSDTLALAFGAASLATFSGNIAVSATKRLILDGATNTTYIHEVSNDVIEFMVGGTALFRLTNTILQVYASGTWREVTFKTVTDMLGDATAHALCVHY